MKTFTARLGSAVVYICAALCVFAAGICFAQGTTAHTAAAGPAHRSVLIAGGDYKYRPYEYLDEDSRVLGFNVEILTAVARQAGLEVSIELGPWDEVRRGLAEDRIDILTGLANVKGIPVDADFVKPHMFIDYVLFVRTGSGFRSLENSRGRSILVRRGSPAQDYLAAKHGENRIVPVDTVTDALHLLSHQGYDSALLPRRMANNIVAESGIPGIEAVGEPLFRAEYGLAVRTGNKELLDSLNEGLSKVMSSGQFARLQDKWLESRRRHFIDPGKLVLLIVAAVGLAAMLLLLLMVVSRNKTRMAEMMAQVNGLESELESRLQNEGNLRSEKNGLISLLKNAPHGVLVLGGQGAGTEILYTNRAVTEISGYSAEDIAAVEAVVERALPDAAYRDRIWHKWQTMVQEDFPDSEPFAMRIAASDGEIKHVDIQARPLGDGRVIVMFSDITQKHLAEEERQRLDEQIRQSQKLEAMGQLAGGVAHDFNNIMTSIQGNAQLLLMEDGMSEDASEMLEEVVKATKRASELTKQLLAYARKGKYQVVAVDIHESIREVVSLLHHSIDKLIDIRQDLQADRPMIMGDPTQLHGALLNLAVNARDAMPSGGTLTFATSMIMVDKDMCRKFGHDISPGEYLQVKVSDTGTGIDATVMKRIFEPFFSTKQTGKGTGLGLAAVYGCVKNHHGSVSVESEPGKGTLFTLFLPTVGAAKKVAASPIKSEEGMIRGKGHVMLVDDEEGIRALASRALRKLGYRVSMCADGAEAIDFYRQHSGEVDLVILDLIMPNVDGRTVFREMKKINPLVRVIVVSGFSAESAAAECLHEGALDFLSKPFWVGDLSKAVATYIV
jgi:PAS domain S-box-containing protein